MSHLVDIELEIKDLEALRLAAESCGLRLNLGQKKYRWYGTHVGDYPLPMGFGEDELGQCEHALSVVGKPDAYEIGIVRRRDGKPGYTLLWDFYAGGGGLVDAVGGLKASKLKQRYQVEVFRKAMAKKGLRVNERMENGKLKVEAYR